MTLIAGREAVLRQNGELDVRVAGRGWVGIGRVEPYFDGDGKRVWVAKIPNIWSVWGNVESDKSSSYRRQDAIRWAVQYVETTGYLRGYKQREDLTDK